MEGKGIHCVSVTIGFASGALARSNAIVVQLESAVVRDGTNSPVENGVVLDVVDSGGVGGPSFAGFNGLGGARVILDVPVLLLGCVKETVCS